MNLASIQAAAGNLGRWALRRAQERSTWAGLAILATALGHAVLADKLAHIGDGVALILGAGGIALASATTTPHLAPAPEADPLPTAPVDQAGGAGNAA